MGTTFGLTFLKLSTVKMHFRSGFLLKFLHLLLVLVELSTVELIKLLEQVWLSVLGMVKTIFWQDCWLKSGPLKNLSSSNSKNMEAMADYMLPHGWNVGTMRRRCLLFM